jgi:hypothetical protein
MKATTLGIVLATAIALAVACGSRQKVDTRKQDEITALWTQIRNWRREAHLPVDPRREDVIALEPVPVDQAKHVCPDAHPIPPSCGDVCSLADAICDNAESICILADELGKGDKWAQDKCASAKASCRDAKQLCCKCSETDRKATMAW